MGETTAISWADATYNPWMGCAKVSPGCANCYMFREQRQYGNDPLEIRRSKTKFDMPLKLAEPSVIFTCSWSDFFIEEADPWRDEAWDVIRRTPQHVYLILSKRLELASDRLPLDWPLPNVWLGTSIENARHSFRADLLRELPAERRFISAEPLLGSLLDDSGRRVPLDLTGIDWLIVGGESGSRDDARPMHPAWARELRDAAFEADVAFHMKQWGSWSPYRGGDVVLSRDGRRALYGGETSDFVEPILVRYCGPKPDACGRLLDGHEYLDRPVVRSAAAPVTTLF